MLFEVDKDEVGAVLAMTVPPHPNTTFDEGEFLDLIARSFSITMDEKRDIVMGVGKYGQHQIDELFRILKEERVKFAEMRAKHEKRVSELSTNNLK